MHRINSRSDEVINKLPRPFSFLDLLGHTCGNAFVKTREKSAAKKAQEVNKNAQKKGYKFRRR